MEVFVNYFVFFFRRLVALVVSTLCTWFSRETPNKKRPPRRSFSLRQSQWATA